MRIWPVILILLIGCGDSLTQGRGFLQFKENATDSKKEETKTKHQGPPVLIKKGDVTYNIESEDAVTINPPKETNGRDDLKGLTPEILLALAKLNINQSNDTTSDQTSSYTFDLHKKWHTVSAVVIIALCILLLVIRMMAVSARKGMQNLGFDPKTIGFVATKLMRMGFKSRGKLEDGVEYIDRRMGENHLDANVKAELQRQKNWLLDLKGVYGKLDDYDQRGRHD